MRPFLLERKSNVWLAVRKSKRLRAAGLGLVALLLAPHTLTGQQPDLRDALRALSEVGELEIVIGWIGLSPASPQQAEFILHLIDGGLLDGGLHGTGRFTVGPSEVRQLTDTVEVEIPGDAAVAFFEELAALDPQAGEYIPSMEHTDDYPSLSISAQTPGGALQIYSQSQGAGHAPWGLTYGTRTYIIDSTGPDRALDHLRPYLSLDVQARLVAEAESR